MQHSIVVEDLRKAFTAPRQRGQAGSMRLAVDGLCFTVSRGERVAFIGPNGAGKSTTLKILSGILHPDSGRAEVLGLAPWEQRRKLGFRLGTVFGQRSQLWQDLPATATFELLRYVYERPLEEHRKRLADLVELFGLAPLLDRAVRKLSLGERMRCELVASLLHAPEVLFLDEPTIGLDVSAKAAIRELIRERSERDGMTLVLTSHDTGDIERVCDRVLIVQHGRIVMDCPVIELQNRLAKTKRVSLSLTRPKLDVELPGARVLEAAPFRVVVEVDLELCSVGALVQAAAERCGLRDVAIDDPPLDELIRTLYESTAPPPREARATQAVGAS
jgi:ABC-2 type transport system ATP-binding protein